MIRAFLILLGPVLLLTLPAAVNAQAAPLAPAGDSTATHTTPDPVAARPTVSAPGDELPEGTRVRFQGDWGSRDWIQGRLAAADSTGITVQIGAGGRVMRVPRSSLARFETAAGTLPGGRRTANGARRGGKAGIMAVGALVLAMAASDEGGDDNGVPIAALIGVPVTLGAMVAGMLAEPGTKWRAAPVPVRAGPPREARGDEDPPVHAVRRYPAGAPGLRGGRSPFDPHP